MLATGNSTAAAIGTVERGGAPPVRLIALPARADARRLTRRPIPRLGGLAIFLGIVVPSLAFLNLSDETRGVLLGAAVATVVGAVDDFRGLSPPTKLAGQVAAAAIPISFGVW